MDLSVFKRLLESSDWVEVCKEIDMRIASFEKSLRKCKADELVRLQAQIEAYEELKLLPGQVVAREE